MRAQFEKSQELVMRERKKIEEKKAKHEVQKQEEMKTREQALIQDEAAKAAVEAEKKEYRKKEAQRKEEIIKMKKQRDEDAKKRAQINESLKKEDEKNKKLMEDTHRINKIKDRIERRKTEAKIFGHEAEASIKSERDRRKLLEDSAFIQKSREIKTGFQKKRGDIDNEEKAQLQELAELSRSEKLKLTALEQQKKSDMQYDFRRRRLLAGSIPDAYAQRKETMEIDAQERSETSKIEAQMRKAVSDLEANLTKRRFEIETFSRRKRDKLAQDERQTLIDLENQKLAGKKSAEEEAGRKIREIPKKQKEIIEGSGEEKSGGVFGWTVDV